MGAFATILDDRRGVLLDKIEKIFPLVTSRFESVAVIATQPDARVLDVLRASGAQVATRPSDSNKIGRNRRDAVAMALESGVDGQITYGDLDHVLRWVEIDGEEFDGVLQRGCRCDCLVIGRGPRSMAAIPRRLAATESIVNEIYALISGRRWDLMMATRCLSRNAARLIVSDCTVDTIGNDVAWPLFCERRGMTMDYIEAEGLTYRTNRDYVLDIAEDRDDDPAEWIVRVQYAFQHVEAMRPYLNSTPSQPS
jgi:hypothetical protein